MKKNDQSDDWPSLPSEPRSGHRYLITSIAMPLLGLLLAYGYLSTTPTFGGLKHWPTIGKDEHKQLDMAFWLTGIAGLVGLSSAVRSIARREKPGCLAVPSLFLNGALVLMLLAQVVEAMIDRSGFK